MYKVLLVDDENIIIDSISSLINWNAHGFELLGAAYNGLKAFRMICDRQPDIVITDIKMPGMNGLDLVAKVREELPDTVFIILSGYGEFEFASRAIQFGVKHYLLKPCDEEDLLPVLIKIKDEMDRKHSRDTFVQEINQSIRKVLPQVKEQFLRDFATTERYSRNDAAFFIKLFKIEEEQFQLVLLHMSSESDFLERFALKNIAEEIIGNDRVCLSTTIEGEVLLLIQPVCEDELVEKLEEIRDTYNHYYKIDIISAVSKEMDFYNIPSMYAQTWDNLKYAFYLGDGSIITDRDANFIKDDGESGRDLTFGDIASFVKTGDLDHVQQGLAAFFDRIDSGKLDIHLAKSYCMELYLTIARQCGSEPMNEYFKGVVRIQDMNTLNQIKEFITATALEIARMNYDKTRKKHSMVIDTVIQCIRENLQNPELSLTWIAKEVLFMNENYLGKLFAKEMNEKFSQYVMRVRIEKARELFDSPMDYKIYEVSEMTGFADYPQYFSQVFKKYTGFTPSEYKKNSMG
jgi:two-component system response regulator YesN